jgi:two-component system cell cycle sensor histidine kinase/response regulator CckA
VLPGDYVKVELTDTGTGIAAENFERIFKPLFSTKEVGAGTGFDLSTVQGIVSETGGFIMVDSTLGKGTPSPSCCPAVKKRWAKAPVPPIWGRLSFVP